MSIVKTLRLAILALTAILPSRSKPFIYSKLFGWSVARSARIGMSLIVSDHVTIGENAEIGHFNVIRNLHTLGMDRESVIGQWNWISASPDFARDSAFPSAGDLYVGQQAAITSRHYVDCSGGVSIGELSVLGGVRSTILSHQIDMSLSRQTASPVSIGRYCFIGSNTQMVAGSSIPDRCVVAMGSVVADAFSEEQMLYAGVPARPKKKIDGPWFYRTKGPVTP